MVVLTGSVPFVARERELAVLDDVLGSATDGRGSTALVRAPAGTGKTRLADEALDRSCPAGATVLRATAAELQREVPFALADDLLRRHDHTASTAGAYATALERAALDGPLVVVADDLQWCDDGSLLVLAKLALSSHDLPITLLLLTRPAPAPSALLRLERAVERTPVTATIDLPSLDTDELLELAAATLGDVPPPAVTELLAATGGNALHATTVLRRVAATGSVAIEDVRPGIDAAVLRHVRDLPEETLAVLRWGAVMGVGFRLDDLGLVTTTPADDLRAMMQPAIDLGVLVRDDGLRFAHDLVRGALLREEGDDVVATRHTQVLAALAAADAPPARWAGHLDHANLRDLTAATGLLHRAAASPLPVPAHRRAAWLDRAVELHEDPPLDVLLDLLDARRFARDLEGHHRLLQQLLQRLDEMRPDQRTRLGLCAAIGNEDLQSTLDLQRELVAAGADEGASLVVELLEAERRGAAERDAAARRVLAAPAARQHPELRARAAFLLTVEERDGDRLDELVSTMLEAARQQVPHEARFTALLSLASIGSTFDRAAPLLDEAIDLAVHLGSQTEPLLRAAQLWLTAYGEADWHVAFADRSWRDVVAQVTSEPSRDWLSFTLPFVLLGPLVDLGRDEDVDWLLGRLEAHGAQSTTVLRGELRTRVDGLVRQSRAMVAITRGRPESAREDLASIMAVGDWDLAVLATRAGAPELAEACAAAAEQRRAETPNERNERNARWAAAAAAGSAGPLGGEVTPLWAEDQRYGEHLQLDEVLGDLHAGDGDTEAAVHHHELALAWFEERAARVGAARVRAKLRALGVQPSSATRPSGATNGWDAITPAEWRTLDLIERDLLYREIAEELFLSRRTVESHVQSARRKLDAPDRRTLTGLLREGDGATRLAAWRATPS